MNEETSITEHLEELRSLLIKICVTILISTFLLFNFSSYFFDFITKPLNHESDHTVEVKNHRFINQSLKETIFTIPTENLPKNLQAVEHIKNNQYLIHPGGVIEWEVETPLNKKLLILSPVEGFTNALKLSFWFAIVLSCPVWGYFIFCFILPALHTHEKRLILPFVVLSLIFMSLGALFAFYFTIPIANHYLETFNQSLGQNAWSLAHYLDYTILLILGSSLSFEVFAILFLLIELQVLTVKFLKKQRKVFVVISFIAGAILTPPDILSQILIALPLIGLYEIAITYAKLRRFNIN